MNTTSRIIQGNTWRMLRWHVDPNGGYVEAPASELLRLGIADQISNNSYLCGTMPPEANGKTAPDATVYLCDVHDAHVLVQALQNEGRKVRLCPVVVKSSDLNPARVWPRYRAPEPVPHAA